MIAEGSLARPRLLSIVVAVIALWSGALCANDTTASEHAANDPELDARVAAAVERYLAEREDGPTGRWQRFVERFTAFGDLRFRQEASVKRDSARDRHRTRLRFRIGGRYQLRDDLEVAARLVTGDRNDPHSTHVTLGDGLDDLEASLDRVYARYSPQWAGGVSVTAGKFGHAFLANPIYGELVWDGDIQPEGVAIAGRWGDGTDAPRFAFVVGEYLLIEQGGGSDTSVTVGQVSTEWSLGSETHCKAALGYYHYGSTTPDDSTVLIEDDRGNRTLDRDADGTPDAFRANFGILNPIVVVTRSFGSVPVTAVAEAIVNVRTGSRNRGVAAGLAVGSTRAVGDWKAYYQWQLVEQDAVFSPFSQDDFPLGTNHRSHVLGLRCRCAEAVTLHLWALGSRRERRGMTATTDSDAHQWNLRFDIDLRF